MKQIIAFIILALLLVQMNHKLDQINETLLEITNG